MPVAGFRSRTIAQFRSAKQGLSMGLIFSFGILNPNCGRIQAWRGRVLLRNPVWEFEAEEILKINPTFSPRQ